MAKKSKNTSSDDISWRLEPLGDGRRRHIRIAKRKPVKSAFKSFSDIASYERAYSRADFEFPNLAKDQRQVAGLWDRACGRPVGVTSIRRLDRAICQAEAAKQALLLVDETARYSSALAKYGWERIAVTIVSHSWSGDDYRAEIHRRIRRDVQRWLRDIPYPLVFLGAVDVCKNRIRDASGQTKLIWQPHCHGELIAQVPKGGIPALKADVRRAVKATSGDDEVVRPLVCKEMDRPEGWRLYVATSLMLRGVTQRSQWRGPEGTRSVQTEPLSNKDKRQVLLEWSRETPQARLILAGLRKQGDQYVPTSPLAVPI